MNTFQLLLIPTLLFPFCAMAQVVEIETPTRMTNLSLHNSADSVVVVLSDGTLGRRDATTLGGESMQVLSISNDTIYLTNGGYVMLPTDDVNDADADPMNELQSIAKVGNSVTLSNGGGSFEDSVDDADADPMNELQALFLSGDTLRLSNGGFVVFENLQDGLGNHMATQNLQTKGYYLSHDGDNEGIFVDTLGRIAIGSNLPDSTSQLDVNGKVIATSFQGDGALITNLNSGFVRKDSVAQMNPNTKYFLVGDSIAQESSKMFFDSEKGSFFAGGLFNKSFNPSDIGLHSVSLGTNSFAKGDTGSVAMGYNSTAMGHSGSIALGRFSFADGNNGSIALGNSVTNRGHSGSIAMGHIVSCDGDTGAVAMGYINSNFGNKGSIAMGSTNSVFGNSGSMALGFQNNAFGNNGSMALGHSNSANGDNGSIALGHSNSANGDNGSIALGHLNSANGDNGSIALGYLASSKGDEGAIAIGNSVSADSISSICIGAGASSGEFLINNITRSLMIGFNSDLPTFFVGPSAGASTIGRVGIGTTTPSSTLDVMGESKISTPDVSTLDIMMNANEIKFHNGGNQHWSVKNIDTSGHFIISRTSEFYDLGSAGNDVFIISPSQNVGIGRTPTTNKFEVEGAASKSAAGDWIANSDARLKKNITNLNGQEVLNKLLQLDGITYEWNDNKTGTKRPEGLMYGFTAQNIQEVFPSLVREDKLGYLQTAYGTYDAMYVEAIKELNNQIAKQQEVILELKSQLERVNALEARLSALESSHISEEE